MKDLFLFYEVRIGLHSAKTKVASQQKNQIVQIEVAKEAFSAYVIRKRSSVSLSIGNASICNGSSRSVLAAMLCSVVFRCAAQWERDRSAAFRFGSGRERLIAAEGRR